MVSGEPKILIVDDQKQYLADFQVLFSEKFNIVTASTAEEALAIMPKEPIGVVISDQRMPHKTGRQFLTEIKERYPHTVRILLSGYCKMDALVEAVNKGRIWHYLTKDQSLQEIETVIRQAIEKFKSDEEIRERLESAP